ncbi:Transcription elongation factor 1 homolog [Linum grandiflorum]
MNAKRPKIEKLDLEFQCPFCQNPKSVTCAFSKETSTAEARCFVCDESYWVPTNHLTEAIDVYTEWIDACVEVNPKGEEVKEDNRFRPRRSRIPSAGVC